MELVYDPDHPNEFAMRWLDEVDPDHEIRGKRYNGWAFCNADREVIDVLVSDVENEWVGPGPVPPMGEGFPSVVAAAPPGTTDVLGIHGHPADDPHGPCPQLDEFAAAAQEGFDEAGMRLRAILVIRGERLDGVLNIEDPKAIAQELFGTTDRLAIAQQLLANPILDLMPDSVRTALEAIAEAESEGDVPDLSLLGDAIEDLEGMMDEVVRNPSQLLRRLPPPAQPKIDPLALPELKIPKDWLN